ncbi:anhydro-N-acetylmuramic acid kinase [Aquiluna sp.]|nr:anhydro-N-acetylmuramic acid kinase [Aquiluna sp.]
MKVLGLISGTSHDGIDACMVEFKSSGALLEAKVLATAAKKYSPELRNSIIEALPPNQTTIEAVCRLDTYIGQEFGALAKELVAEFGPVDLVSSHGQTVFHLVEESLVLGTLQLGQPAWIAASAGASVISDVRIQDIVSGGQGAPIVPILDLLVLGGSKGTTGSLNLGGIANVTVIKDSTVVTAFDTGPASALIDALVLKYDLHPAGFDLDGLIAASGTIHQELLGVLLSDPYYCLPGPKSTGKELFHVGYFEKAMGELGLEISAEDQLATATELTAQTVSDAVSAYDLDSLVAAGGGIGNKTLIRAIEQKTGLSIQTFSDYGIDADHKEALAMALIGWLSIHNHSGTLSNATGAKNPPILGRLTPGPEGYVLPTENTSFPSSMVIHGG